MRNLTAKQKKLLTETLTKENKRDILGSLDIRVHTVEDLTSDIWDKLEEMNDTEVLYQNTNRFIGDFNSDLTYKN